jgi:diguanylate cyclase (GGDEF)-like protein
MIDDLGSSNGTYVNGIRVTSSEVTEGAVIQIGPRARFRFSVIDHHQERMLRQMYDSSVRDPLTGIFNRAYFKDRLDAELAYLSRHRTAVSILILDIDHFKNINDTYGHAAGDLVLKCFTATLFGSLRTEDLLARYGGEEFVVLLRDISIENAYRAAERLRRSVSEMVLEFEGKRITLTVSVGGASTACANVTDSESLIAAADRRLYAAKNGGRNAVVTSG